MRFLLSLGVVGTVLTLGVSSVLANPVSPLRIAGQLSARPVVERLAIQAASANDRLFSRQDNLNKLKVPEAWESTTGSNLVIAVIDTGVDKNHEDLKDKLWSNPKEIADNKLDDDGNGYVDDVNGYNFVADNANINDNHGHGTGIASIIAASTNNRVGIAGINWSARLMTLKALDSTGGGDFAAVAKAIRYAADNGAKIINTSFGAASGDSELRSAVQYALSKNVLIIAAAGNSGVNDTFYPAAYSGVVSVGSVTDRNKISGFSNYGNGLDLVAPGEAVPVAARNNEYIEGYGTSFATAEVSGIASLVWSRFPAMSSSQVARTLIDTADELVLSNKGTSFKAGLVDAQAAVTKIPVSLAGAISVSNASVLANGIDFATVTATITSNGQSQYGQKLKAVISGRGNIINGNKIIGDNVPVEVGITDATGRVSFSLASIYSEPKTIKVISDNGDIPTFATVNFMPINNNRFQAEWVSQSPAPTVKTGDTASLQLALKNTGQTIWLGRDADVNFGQIKLGTDRVQDRASAFYDSSSWLSSNRIGTMSSSFVRPGEIATFVFTIKAPSPGRYREYFRPVVEGMAWLNDLGIYWDITVGGNGDDALMPATDPKAYAAQLVDAPASVDLRRGQTENVSLALKNIGQTVWQPTVTNKTTGEVKLGTANPVDRHSSFTNTAWLSASRVIGSDFKVSPGSTLSLSIPLTAPTTAGSYTESFRLVSEFVTWFGPVISIPITVR